MEEAPPNYHPNSFDNVDVTKEANLPPSALSGTLKRHDHRGDDDYCATQLCEALPLHASKATACPATKLGAATHMFV